MSCLKPALQDLTHHKHRNRGKTSNPLNSPTHIARQEEPFLMETTYVELQEIPVLRVRAEMKGKGPSATFNLLESKLQTIKGRKFYGTFQPTPDGEEYYACVARIDSDDPEKMQLETGTIPGGWYARRRFPEWEKNLSKLPATFEEMARTHDVDPAPPSLEFYQRPDSLVLFC